MTYGKSILAVVATIVTAFIAALADNSVSGGEWVNVAILAVGACAVFSAPNVPGSPVTKAVLAVLTAVLVLLASLITDGLTTAEVGQLVVAALGALGVYAVPGRSTVPNGV